MSECLWDKLKDIDSLKEFTPIPFWFWNDELSEKEILRQMKEMKDKGVDGFVIHPRKGLPRTIKYLSEEYFYFVKFAVRMASEMDMKVVLYDEAMYPSGSCHGEVVKAAPEYASKGLMRISSEEVLPLEAKVLAEISENGELVRYTIVPSCGTIRGVHEEEDDGEMYAPKSADLLNPKAVAKFIELTHEKYYSELSEYFGNTIVAFFTDEPNILGRNCIESIIPWSDGILEEFEALGGERTNLKYLFSDNNGDELCGREKEEACKTKLIYKSVIHRRLSDSYYKQLSDWCASHNIALTGHPEKSTDIGYLKYFQIPCQDIVWRFVEPEEDHSIVGEHSTMGKCSSDSARHRGKRRNGNECFGCCGERKDPKLFTENDMKWYLNWLFIRGVNLVYPHAFYYSIRDDRGDERPPEVGLNNPFWPQYSKMSKYIKRMCFLNTDAVNQADVAIICDEDTLSWKMAKPLFTHQIEFNYLEKELISDCRIISGKRDKEKISLKIASQSYFVIVVSGELYEAIEGKEKEIIDEFASNGGRLLIVDEDTFSEEAFLSEVSDAIDSKIGFDGDTFYLRTSHLIKDDTEYILLSNEKEEAISFAMNVSEYDIVKVVDPYTEKEISFADGVIKLEPYELIVAFIKRKL